MAYDPILDHSPYDASIDPDILSDVRFLGTERQTTRRIAYCKIIVAGRDVTSKVDPFLISVRVLDGPVPYHCELELDDRDGRLDIPPLGSPVSVTLGWYHEDLKYVFNGIITDLEHGFGRKQGGRRMWVRATGANYLSNIKTPLMLHLGDGAPPGKEEGDKKTFGEWAGKVGAAAGATVKINPKLAAKAQDYWSAGNESALHNLEKYAKQFGGLMIVRNGNEVELTVPGENSGGGSNGVVNCKWGDNLIGWRVRPLVARSAWKQVNSHYYDTMKGTWQKVQKSLGLPNPWGDADATYTLPAPAPNAGNAGNDSQGTADEGGYAGEGRIVINGETSAVCNCWANIIGARPGVDGQYLVKIAEHLYSRQGFITWLDVYPHSGLSGSGGVGSGYSQTPATGSAAP